MSESQAVEFDRAKLTKVFACPDNSKMKWTNENDEHFQCRGCSGMCGTNGRRELFTVTKQAEFLLT